MPALSKCNEKPLRVAKNAVHICKNAKILQKGLDRLAKLCYNGCTIKSICMKYAGNGNLPPKE